MKIFNLFGGVALLCLIGSCDAMAAGSINGMQTAAVCDPYTNDGKNCLKPAADGSIAVTGGGGGGGGGAVYGPTATGAAAANPPVVVGGTINGGATGNVQGAAMKAASTAPAATDPAIVVALSPNGAQATAAKQAAFGTAGASAADVYSVQGIAGGTPQTVNNTQVNGVAISTGSGLTGTGTQREAEAAAAPTASSAIAANTVICGAACQLTSFDVSADSTLSGAAWWIMIYNATSAPADGAVTPIKCYAMQSGSTGIAAAFPAPLNLTTGATIGVSTTGCFSKTASTHAFISGDSR